MTSIPLASRDMVRERQRGLCFRCMMPGSQWHHRRGRAVVDAHTHCPCNGLWLCAACHMWAHKHPTLAEAEGLIVSRSETQPYRVSLHGFDGWWENTCEGLAIALLVPRQ